MKKNDSWKSTTKKETMSESVYETLGQYPWWWRYGGRRDFWVSHISQIEKFIEASRLKPSSLPQFSEAGVTQQAMQTRSKPLPIPFPGGMRIAHLHVGDKVFLLDDKQWKNFTNHMMESLRAKLASVNTVPFEEMMDLGEALARIPAEAQAH